MSTSPPIPTRHDVPLGDLIRLFVRLGFTAFGGPAAHIAMMRQEVVEKRRWMDDRHFLDLLGATNLIPGPNSSEMAIHIGYTVAGWRGLLAGGLAFSLPAVVIVTALAALYVTFGQTPTAGFLLYGIKPVIIPIIIAALIGLSPKALKDTLTRVIGVAAAALYFTGLDNALLLVGAGVITLLIVAAACRAPRPAPQKRDPPRAALLLPLAGLPALAAAAALPFSLLLMFLTFLKIGAVLYGSGYTLFAFLQADFVNRLGWLTGQQLVDAIAIGQVTPGPVVTSATFIGYVLGARHGQGPLAGLVGALIATAGIYIPSYLAVAISNPLIPRIRASRLAGAFLDGVNAAALGLMAAVTVQLALAAYPDLWAVGAGIAAALALFVFKVDAIWLVAGGALFGLLSQLLP
jgi:chromate transporter